MKKYENMCVGCPPETGCLGKICPNINVPMYYCDVCHLAAAKYTWNGDDYCEDCLKNRIDSDFEQLSVEEKSRTLGYDIVEIDKEWYF